MTNFIRTQKVLEPLAKGRIITKDVFGNLEGIGLAEFPQLFECFRARKIGEWEGERDAVSKAEDEVETDMEIVFGTEEDNENVEDDLGEPEHETFLSAFL